MIVTHINPKFVRTRTNKLQVAGTRSSQAGTLPRQLTPPPSLPFAPPILRYEVMSRLNWPGNTIGQCHTSMHSGSKTRQSLTRTSSLPQPLLQHRPGQAWSWDSFTSSPRDSQAGEGRGSSGSCEVRGSRKPDDRGSVAGPPATDGHIVSHKRAAWSRGKLLNLGEPRLSSLGCGNNTAVSQAC